MIPYTYDFDYYVGDTYPIVIYDGSVEEKDLFVALRSQVSAISTNGTSWTPVTLPVSDTWIEVAYGNGRFVSCRFGAYSQRIATSSIDGDILSWSIRTLPVSSNWYSIAFGNNTFVTIGRTGSGRAPIAISTDGITWERKTMVPAQGSSQWTVDYGNGIFVAVANYSNRISAVSTNGITWTSGTMPLGDGDPRWHKAVYGNNIFVSIGKDSNRSAYSTNGILWTETTLPISLFWSDIVYGNGRFVAVPGNVSTASISSTNGITWTQGTLPVISFNWSSITYANGFFYAKAPGPVGDFPKSTDGITWQSNGGFDYPGSGPWNAVTFAKALYPKNITYSLNKTGLFTVSTQRGNPESEIFSIPAEISYPEYRLTVEIDPSYGSLLTGASYVYDIEVRDDNEVFTLLTGTITTQQDVKSN